MESLDEICGEISGLKRGKTDPISKNEVDNIFSMFYEEAETKDEDEEDKKDNEEDKEDKENEDEKSEESSEKSESDSIAQPTNWFNAMVKTASDTLQNAPQKTGEEDGTVTSPVPNVDNTNSDSNLQEIANFGIQLLMFSTLAHFWHLNCEKNSQHVALQDLYESIEDIADSIMETIIGKNDSPITPTDLEIDFGDLNYSDSCIEKIESIRDKATQLKNLVAETYPGLESSFSDVVDECDTAIYKLSRFE